MISGHFEQWARKHAVTRALWNELFQTMSRERAHRIVRMTALVVVVVVISMTLRVPEAAISAYMVFFVARQSKKTTVITGVALTLAAALAIAATLIAYSLCLDSASLRLVVMLALSLCGMYFSRVSPLGPVAFAIGFIVTLGLSLADLVGVPELLVRGLLWVGVAVAYPSLLVAFTEAFFGESGARQFSAGFNSWQSKALRCFMLPRSVPDTVSSRHWLNLQLKTSELAELATSTPKDVREANSQLVNCLDGEVALALVARGLNLPTNSACSGSKNSTPTHENTSSSSVPSKNTSGSRFSRPRRKLLVEDAFTNRIYLRFAVKTAVSVMIAYITYTMLGWSEIRTAMITCFFVASESLGDTLQKLRLRIVGAVAGGVLAIVTVVWVVPHLESVLGLVVLAVIGTLPAAWFGTASPRLAYAGWQMAIAFYLCVFKGFSPSLDMVAARDRIIGILLGNAIVTAVHVWLWPVSTLDIAESVVGQIRKQYDLLRALPTDEHVAAYDLRCEALENLKRLALALDARSHEYSTGTSSERAALRALFACSQLGMFVVAGRVHAANSSPQSNQEGIEAHRVLSRAIDARIEMLERWFDSHAMAGTAHAAIGNPNPTIVANKS